MIITSVCFLHLNIAIKLYYNAIMYSNQYNFRPCMTACLVSGVLFSDKSKYTSRLERSTKYCKDSLIPTSCLVGVLANTPGGVKRSGCCTASKTEGTEASDGSQFIEITFRPNTKPPPLTGTRDSRIGRRRCRDNVNGTIVFSSVARVVHTSVIVRSSGH